MRDTKVFFPPVQGIQSRGLYHWDTLSALLLFILKQDLIKLPSQDPSLQSSYLRLPKCQSVNVLASAGSWVWLLVLKKAKTTAKQSVNVYHCIWLGIHLCKSYILSKDPFFIFLKGALSRESKSTFFFLFSALLCTASPWWDYPMPTDTHMGQELLRPPSFSLPHY